MHYEEPSQPEKANPDDEIRQENEILRIKLQAEFGAVFDEMETTMPADVEQQFLNNVYQFEKAWEKQEIRSVAQMLNQPTFTSFEKLEPEEQEPTWNVIMALYQEANITVDFLHEYPLETRYRFVTEELPLHQAVFVNMPGMILGITYEDFHPNIGAELDAFAGRFLEGWLSKDAAACASCLSPRIVMESGLVTTADEVQAKLQNMFNCFAYFEDGTTEILETSYDRQEDHPIELSSTLGYTEGKISWQASMENAEKIQVSGPFKLYYELLHDEWSIMYFVMPGWKWQED